MTIRRLSAVGLLLTLWAVAWAAPPADRVKVVSPPANAVLPAGPVDIIATGGAAELAIDGKERNWGTFAGPKRAARVRLTPGRHEIRVGDQTVAVWATGQPPPAGFQPARVHPIAAGTTGCAACHETTTVAGKTTVGAAKGGGGCLECHQPDQFEHKHSHPLDPLRNCASCHAPHGAAHKGLLKAPAKKLCGACHDS
ncbi:MAG: cytochrome c3 family protein [Gemmataceae bacterium]